MKLLVSQYAVIVALQNKTQLRHENWVRLSDTRNPNALTRFSQPIKCDECNSFSGAGLISSYELKIKKLRISKKLERWDFAIYLALHTRIIAKESSQISYNTYKNNRADAYNSKKQQKF